MSEVKDKLITAENLKNAYNDNKMAISELKGDLYLFQRKLLTEKASENLFDWNDENLIIGKFVSPSGAMIIDNNFSTSQLIYLNAGTYCYKINVSSYGESAAKHVPIYDANGAYTGYVIGELNGNICVFTLETSCYIRIKLTNPVENSQYHISKIMLVKGSTYPSEYIPYGDAELLNILNKNIIVNPLYGKKITLNGDSICAGAGYSGGYGKILEDDYGMIVQNIGVNGATITAETYASSGEARHWISRTIDNMDADADFAILEGGVNDASLATTMGVINGYYAWNFDDTTFCGAMETALQALVTRFKGKKYGFIFVHKMTGKFRSDNAVTEESYYHMAKKCCEKWGVPYLELNISVPPFAYFNSESCPEELQALRTLYTKDGDGWHPNEDGYRKYYVPKIEAWLKTL